MANDLLVRIKTFNQSRQPEAVQLKYKAMSESPLRFFRGTCHLFYEDLLQSYPFPHSPLAWICGDLHLENFGSYRGENGLLYFDINDFDESAQAPVLYDLSRLVVSIELAASEIGLSARECERLVALLLERYTDILLRGKSWVLENKLATGLIKKLIRKVGQRPESELVARRTDGKRQGAKLIKNDRLWKVDKEVRAPLADALETWFRDYHKESYVVSDIGFRIAGTGSIGVKRYCCLLESEANPADKKLIDVKLATPSSVLTHTQLAQPDWPSQAHRIVRVQEMMEHVPPAYLSPFAYAGDWYVVKELQPSTDKINMEKAVERPRQLEKYVGDLGLLTASAQLRGSGRQQTATADELMNFAETKQWKESLQAWGGEYAERVRGDYRRFNQSRESQ
jgi:uncharacterized protein (DUF2252 family)